MLTTQHLTLFYNTGGAIDGRRTAIMRTIMRRRRFKVYPARMRSILGMVLLSGILAGCGGGGGGSAASAAPGTPPVTTGTLTVVQMNTYQTVGAAVENNSTVKFTSNTKSGDTIWVAVTVSNFGGIHQISVSDTQGNVYTLLDQKDDMAPGTQSVAHFYAAKIVGDTATPDTVTVNWPTDNYKGILIAEIAGTTQAPLVGHLGHIQDGLAMGTDNVTAGPTVVTTAQTPALVLALSMNTTGGASDTGGSGAPGPAAGTGLTQSATFWNWGATLATFATGTVTSAESVTSLFSATHVDSYVTVAAVFH